MLRRRRVPFLTGSPRLTPWPPPPPSCGSPFLLFAADATVDKHASASTQAHARTRGRGRERVRSMQQTVGDITHVHIFRITWVLR